MADTDKQDHQGSEQAVDLRVQQIEWIKYHVADGTVYERAHRILADKSRRSHYLLGVPVVILTTVVGTSTFASLAVAGETSVIIAVVTGVISIVAAVLAALQTFLRFEDDAKAHAEAAANLAKVVHTYRYLLSIPPSMLRDGGLYELDSEYSQIVSKRPAVPLAVEKAAREELKRTCGPDWAQYYRE